VPTIGVEIGAPWRSFLSDAGRAEAVARARSIAAELRDPARLAQLVVRAREETPHPEMRGWSPFTLTYGHGGLALAFGYLNRCFPGEGWHADAHRQLEIAVRDAADLPAVWLGLFPGLSGLGFAASYLATGGRYERLLATLDDRIAVGARARALGTSGRRGVPAIEVDLVAGLTGVGVHLLGRRASPVARAALESILEALIALSREEEGLPGWYVPPEGDDGAAGYLDCGVSQGIPGPLALLSLAYEAGLRADGLPEAIVRIGDWILSHTHDDAWGINWPKRIPLSLDAAGNPSAIAASRRLGRSTAPAGWCYGAPGVSRALWRAGVALDTPRFRDAAVEGMRAVLRRPRSEWRLTAPGLCHGSAGLLQCVLRFANDTQRPEFEDAAQSLTMDLVAAREEGAPLGYRSVDVNGIRIDQPGVLDGASGVMMALLAAATEVAPNWDRAFLIS
jgi:hypothetical protein